MNLERIGLNIAVFASILFLPWWVSLLVALFLIVRFRAYEVILWGLYFDALYGTPIAMVYNGEYVATYVAALALVVSIVIKRRLIFY